VASGLFWAATSAVADQKKNKKNKIALTGGVWAATPAVEKKIKKITEAEQVASGLLHPLRARRRSLPESLDMMLAVRGV